MNTVVLFTNWTSDDFAGKWDNQLTEIKAGQSVHLQQFLAEHFAKHLVDQYLNKAGKWTSDPSREELTAKCFSGKIETKSELEAEIKVLNSKEEVKPEVKEEEPKKKFCDKCDSKGGRHKKDCPNNPKNKETFEGLK